MPPGVSISRTTARTLLFCSTRSRKRSIRSADASLISPSSGTTAISCSGIAADKLGHHDTAARAHCSAACEEEQVQKQRSAQEHQEKDEEQDSKDAASSPGRRGGGDGGRKPGRVPPGGKPIECDGAAGGAGGGAGLSNE